MIRLPEPQHLRLSLQDGVLHLTLHRPERRNALSSAMIDELLEVLDAVSGDAGSGTAGSGDTGSGAGTDGELRAIVLRGAGGSFCAGADLKDLSGNQGTATSDAERLDAIARSNRRFGTLVSKVQATPAPVVAMIEGTVLGGGIGLVCASDVALALHDARFGLPETGLGLIPAQIAPFVVQRIGLTQARRLMLTGARFDGREAAQVGLVHSVHDDVAALEAALDQTLHQIRRCGPRANAATKRLLFSDFSRDPETVLDQAAQAFAKAASGEEAAEGVSAFLQKRPPRWTGT